MGDFETCGRECCCRSFLKVLLPVNMRMAKLQKATLDPSKISGRCGRLKCCLRYEYDTYVELQRELPPVGSEVTLEKGQARVIGQEILAQQLLVEFEDNRRVLVEVKDVLSVNRRGGKGKGGH